MSRHKYHELTGSHNFSEIEQFSERLAAAIIAFEKLQAIETQALGVYCNSLVPEQDGGGNGREG